MLQQLNDRPAKLATHRQINSDGSLNKSAKVNNQLEILKCIKYHQRISELCIKVESIFSFIIFFKGLMTTTLILCTTTFLLTILSPIDDSNDFIHFTVYLIPMVLQIFVPCYYSSQIYYVSRDLSNSLFHADAWIFGDKKYRDCVKMFIGFSVKPIRIRIVKIFELNLKTFMRLFNSAFSLYAGFKHVNS